MGLIMIEVLMDRFGFGVRRMIGLELLQKMLNFLVILLNLGINDSFFDLVM